MTNKKRYLVAVWWVKILALWVLVGIFALAEPVKSAPESPATKVQKQEPVTPATSGPTPVEEKQDSTISEPVAQSPASQAGQTQKETALQPQEQSQPITLPDSDSISFIKSVMALFFVLGLIFLAAYFYKKLMGYHPSRFQRNRVPIDLVGHMALGEKKFLAIVAIEGKHYFIGITPTTINLISELALENPPESNPDGASGGDFESIFQRARALLQQRGKKS